MTASNAHSPLPFRHLATIRVCSLGLAIGLLAATGSATAATAQPAIATVAGNADPARQVPGALEISNIDFKRGDGGAGRLIVRFNGKGAMPPKGGSAASEADIHASVDYMVAAAK